MPDLLKINLSNSFSRKAILKSSFENVCSDDALSKENMGMWRPVLLLVLLPVFNFTTYNCIPLKKKKCTCIHIWETLVGFWYWFTY